MLDRRLSVAVCVVVAAEACASPPPSPPPAPPPPSTVASAPPPAPTDVPDERPPSIVIDPTASEREALIDALRDHRVVVGAAPPEVFYTWTSAQQIAELRRKPKLLTRSQSPTKGPDYFQRVLRAIAKQGDEVAIILTDARFKNARFAWFRAWPTLLGYPGESYGDHLVRVKVRKEALFAEVHRSAGTIRLVQSDGRPFNSSQARYNVERIVGAIFINDVPAGQVGPLSTEPSPSAYREVVLMNEAMIESWEVGTPAIAEEVALGAKLARRLAERAKKEAEPVDVSAWLGVLPRAFGGKHDDTWRGHYAASLALGSELYAPTHENLGKLSDRLSTLPTDEPLVHRVTATFPPGPIVGLPPLRPPIMRHPRGHGTF